MGKIITDTLIDKNYIESKLIELLPYSIIINSSMRIISISKGVKNLLLYEANESKEWNINDLIKSSKKSFKEKINQLQNQGFFEPTLFELQNKYGGGIKVTIAAFYLGLLSDSNDRIVLIVQDLDKIKKYHKILENKIIEFNELVYRASHDLKGPIATMRGLVNISEYETDTLILKNLFKIFSEHLDILDNKTSIISSLSANESHIKLSAKKISIDQLNNLTNEILENYQVNNVMTYNPSTANGTFLYYDYQVLIKIIKSICDSFISFPSKNSIGIDFKFIDGKNDLQLVYTINGIKIKSNFINILQQSDILIKEALSNHTFQKFYNLKSLINKYHGYLEFDYHSRGIFQYMIYLPKELN